MEGSLDGGSYSQINEEVSSKKAKWYCVHFAEEKMDAGAIQRFHAFLSKLKIEISFGERRAFFNVGKSEWRNSLHGFQRKISIMAKKINLNPESWQWGVGETLAESWVQARWRSISPDLLPLEAMKDYLNPFETERKNPSESRKFRLLRSLGVNTLQDLIEMREDVLLSQYGIWLGDFSKRHFSKHLSMHVSKTEEWRETWLEKTTEASLTQVNRPFQLEDWIPDEYLEVG